jgi:beta-galactosidase
MKLTLLVRSLVAGACAALVVTQLSAADSPREHLSLDANWKFHLGDDWPDALTWVNSGTGSGAASERFNDENWRAVNLPHDWAIELPFDRTADGGHGFKALGPAFPRNSVGWYRRAFTLPKEDEGKRIWLTFDGVFRDATVWVNGWFVSHHEGGYYPFREDITDVVHFGGTNVISVCVDATKFEGWFYEGAGIYRHVWLDKTAPVAIAPDGIFVSSHFKNNVPEGPAQIFVNTELLNETTNQWWPNIYRTVTQGQKPSWQIDAVLKYEIVTPNGKTNLVKDQMKGLNPAHLLGREQGTMASFEIKSPVLWSPENPKLYRLITTVSVDGTVVDQEDTTFGIRTVGFDPTNGFLLNGRHYELYGTCNHQDMAGVGAALPDALQSFRVAKLKEFGCNAIRTSHNPPTPELLDACDRLGMLIMDESRLLGGDSLNLRKWDVQIRRDRNHPSVTIWSVANEQFAVQDTPQAGNAARTMQNYVKQLDPLRPVTYASPEGDVFRGINAVIEVRGWNYHIGTNMDKYHAEHPNQPNVGTEQASAVTTRGIYTNDRPHGYVSAYDGAYPGYTSAETWWSYFAPRPWLSGAFVWTGFDYRGEPSPYSWPCINSHFGILDTCGFPKDSFYYYKSWWTTNTVLHLLPHWNWPDKEGQEIRVDADSNCKQVELFLNGESLGKQTMKPNSHLTWKVKYAPGTLSAKGFDAAGNVIAETKVETTGDATQIQLTPDRKTINADGEDVAVFTVSALDAQGRVVPVAQNKINFSIEGAGKILGVGNGDPSCHEPDTFVPQSPVRNIAVSEWRWKIAEFSTGRRNQAAPEFAPDFDDSSWSAVKPGDMPLKENETAIYRAHVKLAQEDLDNPAIQIHFRTIDDHGWIYVNNQRIGESHDWSARPVFDIKNALRVGDNVIAVGVKNDGGTGGMSPDVNLQVVGKPELLPWSRSLFNGLAQIIVQSTRNAGEFKLTASSDGLKLAAAVVQTQPCTPRPSVP